RLVLARKMSPSWQKPHAIHHESLPGISHRLEAQPPRMDSHHHHFKVKRSSVEKNIRSVWKSSLHLDSCRDAAKIDEPHAGYFDETVPPEGTRQSADRGLSG